MPAGETGAVTLPVSPQDTSDMPRVLTGMRPNAAVLSGHFNSWEDSGADRVWRMLYQHGYRPYEPPGTWTFQDLGWLCAGTSVVYIATHGGLLEDGAGVTHASLLTPELATDDLDAPSTPAAMLRSSMWKGGYLALGYYHDITGWHGPYYSITDKFARDYMRGLRDALVVVNACEVGCQAFYDALNYHGTQVTAVAGYLRGPNVHSDVACIPGSALFEMQSADRGWVRTEEIPSSAVPTEPPGLEARDAFNLGNSISMENAWFAEVPSMSGAYSTAVADGTAKSMLWYPTSAANWGLIPHLDSLRQKHRQVILSGSFGTTTGRLDLSGVGPPAVTSWSDPTVVWAYSVSAYAWMPPVGQCSVALPNGLKSNPLAYYGADIVAGANCTNGTYWLEVHIIDPAHCASSVTISTLDGSNTTALTYTGSKWFVNIPWGASPPGAIEGNVDVVGTPNAHFQIQAFAPFPRPPTIVSPTEGEHVTGVPVFSWLASSTPNVTYDVHVQGPGWEWNAEGLSESSVAYAGPSLVPKASYSWMVHSTDPDTGNLSAVYGSFTYWPPGTH